ncbi:MAG: sulfite exporter TauE/SafE family protein [Rikenellaceae bacterium]|nr:sulfite exporter TauE/SafE family protein [Rikenellaceae bacterium]
MTEFLTNFTGINGTAQWAVLFFCAVLIGMSKTGIQGIGTLVVPVLALVFGGKPSTGLLLPMLCLADLMAVVYYRKNAEWKYILRLLPAAIAGFALALAVDSYIPEKNFKLLLAFCIFIGLDVMFWSEKSGENDKIIKSGWYAPMFGILGGFTTMIGNAAGPVMAVYLLSVRLPKFAFVGTSAWFFMIVNYLKVPLQIFAWNNITWSSVAVDLLCIPFIFLGGLCGIWIVKKLPEKNYRALIIWLTVISTLLLLI